MKAYEVIDSPEKWTTEVFARTADGEMCDALHPHAVAWCAVGAIEKAYGPDNRYHVEWEERNECSKMKDFLSGYLYDGWGSTAHWNDSLDWESVYTTLKELDI